MEQENKLLKEREKERSELMNLDLNDNDHMIRHIDSMRDKYLKMKNSNEDNLKALESKVLDLNKEKKSLANKNIKLKAEQDNLQKDANKNAGDMERNKEIRRRDIELLRKELDMQQRKAKQSTIEYTESRNESLELMQGMQKTLKDLDELTKEKEERTTYLTSLKDKLENEFNLLSGDISQLKMAIFGSEPYLKMEAAVRDLEVEKEKLIMEEKYTTTE
jgi:predicted RNase H-like nuclease (RuvC/YqgF family)